MLQRLIIVCIACWWSLSIGPGPADAYSVISSEPTVEVVNGVTFNQNLRQLQCDPSDRDLTISIQIQKSDGSTDTLVHFCGSALDGFSVAYSGVTPADGKMATIRSMVTNNQDNLGTADPFAPPSPYLTPDQRPMGLHLLELQIATSNGDWATLPDDAYVQAVCTAALARGENPYNYKVCAVGPTTDQYNGLTAAQRAATTAFAQFVMQAELQLNRTRDMQQAFQNTNAAQKNWTVTNDQRVADEQRLLDLTRNKTDGIANGYNSQFRVQNSVINQLAVTSATLASSINASIGANSDVISRLSVDDAMLVSAFNSQLTGFTTYLSDDADNQLTMIRATWSKVIQLFTIFRKASTDESLLSAITISIHLAIDTIESTVSRYGRTLTAFLSDYGTRPLTDVSQLTPLNNHVNIADDVVRQLVVINDVVHGVGTAVTNDCNTPFMIELAPLGPSWQDMYEWLGPSGCDATWNSPAIINSPPYCKCAERVTELQCVIVNSGGIPTPDAIAAWLTQPPGSEKLVDTTTGCVSAGVPFPNDGSGGLDGMMITSKSDVMTFYERIGQRVPYDPSAAYRFISLNSGFYADVAYNPFMANASQIDPISGKPQFENMALNIDADHRYTLIFYRMQQLPLSYQPAFDHLDVFSALIFGTPPDGVLQRPIITQRYPQGRVGRGWEVVIPFFSNDDMLVVSELYPQSETRTTGQISINGVVQPLQSVTVNNPFSGLLPATTVMIWDPPTFSSRAWDTTESSAILSFHAPRRENTMTIMQVASAEHFALDDWQKVNGYAFPADSFTIPAGVEVSVDDDPTSPTAGQCNTTAAVGGGGWCVIRTHFDLEASGVFTDPNSIGTMLFRHKDATIISTVKTPDGPAVQLAQSVCPTARLYSQNAVQYILILGNPLPGVNTVKVEQFGTCTVSTFPPVDIPGGGSRSLSIFPCGNANDLVVIEYTINGIDVPCLNISFPLPGTPRSTSTTLGYSLIINDVHTDAIGTALQEIVGDIANITRVTQQYALEDYTSRGYAVPNDTFSVNAGTQLILQQLFDNASSIAMQSTAQTQNFTEIVDDYDQQQALIVADSARLQQIQMDQYATIVSDNQKSAITLADFAAGIPILESLGHVFVQTISYWFSGLFSAVKASFTNGNVDAIFNPPDPHIHEGFWYDLGSTFVSLANLGAQGLADLADHLAGLAGGLLSDILGWLKAFALPILLLILIVGGLALFFCVGVPALMKCCAPIVKGINKLTDDGAPPDAPSAIFVKLNAKLKELPAGRASGG